MSEGAIEKEIEDLINEVRLRPCLYVKDHPGYKNKNVQLNAWIEIANELGHTTQVNPDAAEMLKQHWATVRGQYTNFLDGSTLPTGSRASSRIQTKNCKYAAIMEWYQPYYSSPNKCTVSKGAENRGPLTQIQPQHQQQRHNEPRQQSTPTFCRPLKRKATGQFEGQFLEQDRNKMELQDEHYKFGMLIASRLRELAKYKSPEFIKDLKQKILNILADARKDVE